MNIFLEKIKNFYLKIKNAFLNEFIKITKGEGNYNKVLFLWGCLPSFFLIFFINKKAENFFIIFKIIFSSFIITYYVWHLYVIKKMLKLHPEYKKHKPTKKEIYNGKTEEEINKIKREQFKTNLQKCLLIKPWNTGPNHQWVVCLDLYIILSYVQIFFNLFN